MKKVILFLAFLSALFALYSPGSVNANVNAKENNSKQSIHLSILENNQEYIYIRVVIDDKTFVFVYLNDGITLVNVYEEED